MAQRRQSEELQRRVKQLVAEGHLQDAYELLVAHAWVPRGCGYQENPPTGLTVYA